MDELVEDKPTSDTKPTSSNDFGSDEIWEIIDKEDDGKYYF